MSGQISAINMFSHCDSTLTRPICLSMIVRDEAKTIARCLSSVRPYITHWAIVDTGSQDETIKIVSDTLRGIPGLLSQRRWADDFALHRNQAVNLARAVVGDDRANLLFVDADETVIVRDPDAWRARISVPTIRHWWAVDEDWHFRKLVIAPLESIAAWAGARHEYLICDTVTFREPREAEDSAYVLYGHDGYRHRQESVWLADLSHLEASTMKPGGFRERYFSALTLESRRNLAAAAAMFELSADAALAEECEVDDVWQSYWGAGRCLIELNEVRAEQHFRAALNLDSSRAEPALELAVIARHHGQFDVAIELSRQAMASVLPVWTSMYDASAYGWRAVDELCFASCEAQHMGQMIEAAAAYDRILRLCSAPAEELQRIAENLALIRYRIGES